MQIKDIRAREILDSRGNPTLEVSLVTGKDKKFIAGVPSGASTGKYEAVELRDAEKRLFGKGVLKAVYNVEKIIAPALSGMSVFDQEKIDQMMIELDGTENKSRLGANAIIGVSVALCKAAAFYSEKPIYQYISKLAKRNISLPRPLFNVINGGSHTGGGVDFQEFMISPDNSTFKENLFEATEIYHQLGQGLEVKNPIWKNIGDEGGFVPEMKTPKEVLSFLSEISKVDIVLDVAASEFFTQEGYQTKMGLMQSGELIDYYQELINEFPIIGIEDPLEENDFSAWTDFTNKTKVIVIGDDLLVTNPKRIDKAITQKSCNGMILKINQIGTITESLQAAKKAFANNWKIIVSHRSGETNDSFIADFATGIGADFIKSGAPARGERVAKYNRLLEIEEELNIN